MSILISLVDPPEFYTNLDIIAGRVILSLSRPEQVGAVIIKLEGESHTALGIPNGSTENDNPGYIGAPVSRRPSQAAGANIVHENHKVLYKVAQIFPDESVPAHAVPVFLPPGQHEFPFRFKVPFNNGCSDPAAMAKIGGLAGAGGFAAGPSLFGLGGIRVMDGSKQLLYTHVTKTLPPSFTGFPREAEIRYYVKVTIQRPGLFKENWRYQLGFKFLPIEPPRPALTAQEAYARRPFTFRPRSPAPEWKKRSSFFGNITHKNSSSSVPMTQQMDGSASTPSDSTALQPGLCPSIEMSARLPHPSILTCNQPIPLRLIAKKLVPSKELVYLISLQIDLIGTTHVRCQDLFNTETTRWVVVSRANLSILICEANSPVGTEMVLPDALWANTPLPNTVMPSFVTCNLSREYKLELKLGVSWGLPMAGTTSGFGKGKSPRTHTQQIFLPLQFSAIEVFSGLTPPPALLEAMTKPTNKPSRKPSVLSSPSTSRPNQARPQSYHAPTTAPALPARPPAAQRPMASHDVLYPPQLQGDQVPYDDAPPSYDEAMAEAMTGPVFPGARPAWSGVTNENAPSSIPEKSQ